MMGLAMPASRSLIALLIGTVVFFALWMFALKPHSSSNGGSGSSSSQGVGAFKSDINKAHQAVATSNASNAASGNENATSSSGGATASHQAVTPTPAHTQTTATTTAKPTSKSTAATTTKPSTKPSPATIASKQRALAASLTTVESAVHAHKVLALLFYNPLAADDQAVKKELAAVPSHKGQVVKLAIPLDEAAKFTAVTQQVPVNLSPTLVLVSRAGDAIEMVGYSDSFEIDQRVDSALSASGSAAS
jgi:hypothetical protein